MLNRIILYFGATATSLIFVLVAMDLTFLGKRNLIRKGFTDLRVFIWLFGIPCIILLLILLVFQVLPTYLFPIQTILLMAYGISRKQIIVKLYDMDSIQPTKLPNNAFERITNHPLPCFTRFVNILVILALAICGALWVLENEDNPRILYPAVIAIFLIIALAQFADFADLVNIVSRKLHRND